MVKPSWYQSGIPKGEKKKRVITPEQYNKERKSEPESKSNRESLRTSQLRQEEKNKVAAGVAQAQMDRQTSSTSQLRPQERANIGLTTFSLPGANEGSNAIGSSLLLPGQKETPAPTATIGRQVNPDGTPLTTLQSITNLSPNQVIAAYGIGQIPGAISAIGKTSSSFTLGEVPQVGKILVNTATKMLASNAAKKASGGVFWKVVGASGLALAVGSKLIELSFGGRNFGSFIGMEEATQTLDFAKSNAFKQGDWESYNMANEARTEVLKEDSFWDNLKTYIPYKNVGDSLDTYRKAALTAGTVFDKLAENKRLQEETGMSDADVWAKNNEEKAAQEKANIDYYNEERKKMLQWEREAAIEARDQDAAFWAEQSAKQRELEEADRKAIAAFWEAYRKQAAKQADDNRPSKLNFGLI